MPETFTDRLLAAVEAKGSPVCVGLDPAVDRLPAAVRPSFDCHSGRAERGRSPTGRDEVEAVEDFCLQVAEAVAPIVPAVKPQIACFEALGPAGVDLYFRIVRRCRELGLIVIGDVKRGDIGSTARAYAAAHLKSTDAPDAITVNGYFGADGLSPFVDAARATGRGVFVLVRTSNPSAGDVQDFQAANGERFYEHQARLVASLGDGEGLVGRRGYSCIGAVVGATYPDEARRLRALMPRQMFLVPGYGAQGATAADCAAAFDENGAGAIVNASRSVIYAHERPEYSGRSWPECVVRAAEALAQDIRHAVRSAGSES